MTNDYLGVGMIVDSELIEKVEEWREKANSEADPFDKYISIFIAYNIFYNLYEKKKTNNFDEDFSSGDGRRAIGVVELANSESLFNEICSDLAKYLEIIPVFREEYWTENLREGLRRVPISEELKRAFRTADKEKTVNLLVKWLYKVRCNLVHGVKSYKDTHQKDLLQQSACLLDKILGHLLIRYREKYPLNN